jgi:hypothetical protein
MNRQYNEQNIRERAYALWARRGSPIGTPEIDWRNAEAELVTEGGMASELPESHVDAGIRSTIQDREKPVSKRKKFMLRPSQERNPGGVMGRLPD